MTINAGIWIDHHRAVVVLLSDQGEEVLQIQSDQKASGEGKHSHSPSDFVAEDKRERKEMIHLDKYYDEVIDRVHDAKELLIFGPGEAKGEFKRRALSKKFKGHMAENETTDKLTDPQIAAYVRQHFHK
jgi:hypothetical protein